MINANIQSLQEQVDNLYSNLSALQNGQESNGFSQHKHQAYARQTSLTQSSPQNSYHSSLPLSQSRGKQPRFQGPTSSAFNFDVANSSLQTMGITEAGTPEEGATSYDEPLFNSSSQNRSAVASIVSPPSRDPIWKLEKNEAIRLCRVYEEEVGIMFPMFDIEDVIGKANLLFTFTDSAARTGFVNQNISDLDGIDNDDANILKMILSTALTLESSGESELGRMLFDSVREASESRLWEPVEIKGLILLVIVV